MIFPWAIPNKFLNTQFLYLPFHLGLGGGMLNLIASLGGMLNINTTKSKLSDYIGGFVWEAFWEAYGVILCRVLCTHRAIPNNFINYTITIRNQVVSDFFL